MWDLAMRRRTLSPGLNVDFVNGERIYVPGLNAGLLTYAQSFLRHRRLEMEA